MSITSTSRSMAMPVWDPATGAARSTLKRHSALVTAVAFSSDGKLLVSARSIFFSQKTSMVYLQGCNILCSNSII
jgi:WD40 repeat protein